MFPNCPALHCTVRATQLASQWTAVQPAQLQPFVSALGTADPPAIRTAVGAAFHTTE